MGEITVTRDNFYDEVINSDIPVVVDFHAVWCGPCQNMSPVIHNLAQEFENKYKVAKVDIDAESEIAEEYKVMSVPTIKIFKNGTVMASAVGILSRNEILDMLGKW